MAFNKCKKCSTELKHPLQSCSNCGEKPSKIKVVMAWFLIILLLVAGMMWAFTDTEPDVTVDPTPTIE
jgi:predicted nucleic acid-binding Zn ribbon protein